MMDWDDTRIVMTKRQLIEFLKLVPTLQQDLLPTGDYRAIFGLRDDLPSQIHRHNRGPQLLELFQASTFVTFVARGMTFG